MVAVPSLLSKYGIRQRYWNQNDYNKLRYFAVRCAYDFSNVFIHVLIISNVSLLLRLVGFRYFIQISAL